MAETAEGVFKVKDHEFGGTTTNTAPSQRSQRDHQEHNTSTRGRDDTGSLELEYVSIERCVYSSHQQTLKTELSGPATSVHDEGCLCKGHCTVVSGLETDCICDISYDKDGCLLEHFFMEDSPPVTECGSKCTCPSTCPNKASQRPPITAVKLLKTERKGFGVFTELDLPKGTFIGEYVGEVISSVEAKERLLNLSDSGVCYLVQYREHTSSGVIHTNIDATYKGNTTRFINHSCSPNLVMVPVRAEGIVPRLCLFACRDVGNGEELCFSYFGETGLKVKASQNSHCLSFGSKLCYCGSKNCVGYLPLQY